MKVAVMLKDPFSWEDLNEFVILVQDLNDFEVEKTEISMNGITVLLQKKTDGRKPERVEKSMKIKERSKPKPIITKEKIKEELKGWIQLTPRMYYRVEGHTLRIGYPNDEGKFIYVHSCHLSKLKKVYDLLPEKSMAKDVFNICQEVGVNWPKSLISVLMRIFSRHVEFGGEIEKKGNRLVLIKEEGFSLREENRKKLAIEAETIGTPYRVEG